MPKLSTTPSLPVQRQIRESQQKQRQVEKLRREDRTVRTSNFLQRLPLEILAEILSYSSLRTVLAVARSCKWLCTTLTHPDQSFIWRTARKQLYPQPPDPPYDMTEPAYAAVIHSAGNCLVCDTRYIGPPLAFKRRAHLCWKTGKSCPNLTYSVHGTPLTYRVNPALWAIGALERDSLIRQGSDLLPEGETVYCDARCHPADLMLLPSLSDSNMYVWRAERDAGLKEWEAAQHDSKALDSVLKKWSTRAKRMPEIREHNKQWQKWAMHYMEVVEWRQGKTEMYTRDWVMRLGCEVKDLDKSQTFKSMVKVCQRENETCTDAVFKLHETRIEQELEASKAVHERRTAEHERSLKQAYVEAFHASVIQSLFPDSTSDAPSPPVLPTLEAYRALPSISNIIHNPSIPPKGLRKKLRTDETLRKMIKLDLENEDARLRKVMSVRLGVKKKWKPAEGQDGGTAALHPLDRVTALFECTRCGADAKGNAVAHWTALTFADAVRHRCSRYLPKTKGDGSGKVAKNSRVKWDAENFVPDSSGIAVVKFALGLAELSEETTTWDEAHKIGRRWQCLTCPSKVTMHFSDTVGHAKRHKSMMQVPPTKEPSATSTPSEFSFSLNFIQKSTPLPANLPVPLPRPFVWRSKPGSNNGPKEEYGCRHCEFSRVWNSGSKSSERGYTPKKFSFDGLTSHVLRKHGLTPLRTEDVWAFDVDDERGSSKSEETQSSRISESYSPGDLGWPMDSFIIPLSPSMFSSASPPALAWSDDE
ncbi:hypothetical protein FRB90_012791 [Tulasnella sp. 427]|nr:hypothetical protein FRB90_012791 [Tulasnella sp. 427]